MREGGLPDLTGQRVLVTGASGGVGAGIARCFASAGADVALHYRSGGDEVGALADELTGYGSSVVPVHGDLDEPGAASALIAEAVAHLGGLDGLVNNAGLQTIVPLAQLSRDDWDAMLRVNLGAVFELTAEAAQRMDGGWITHIASIEAHRPAAGHAHYATAKAGLLMHSRAAALEYGPRGIRVNTVSPGLVERPGLDQEWPEGVQSWLERAPLGRLIRPEDVGGACVLLASDAASAITGQDLAVDGGMLATPGW